MYQVKYKSSSLCSFGATAYRKFRAGRTVRVSGQAAQSVPLTSLKLSMAVCGQKTGWATFRMNDQYNSLRRPSEGTLN